eukprot:GILJ01005023.1.p1 GENE.GILJ01005023.1~~GILJ01005023.1.p1  ORF type:complete len:472 (-),score=61.03 GILJ01005023.1:78-1493(-)
MSKGKLWFYAYTSEYSHNTVKDRVMATNNATRRVACQECRVQKAKCERTGDGPCVRCSRLKKSCNVVEPQRGTTLSAQEETTTTMMPSTPSSASTSSSLSSSSSSSSVTVLGKHNRDDNVSMPLSKFQARVVDVFKQPKDLLPLLTTAVSAGDLATVQQLCRLGEFDFANNDFGLLKAAMRSKSVKVLGYLLDQGIDLSSMNEKGGLIDVAIESITTISSVKLLECLLIRGCKLRESNWLQFFKVLLSTLDRVDMTTQSMSSDGIVKALIGACKILYENSRSIKIHSEVDQFISISEDIRYKFTQFSSPVDLSVCFFPVKLLNANKFVLSKKAEDALIRHALSTDDRYFDVFLTELEKQRQLDGEQGRAKATVLLEMILDLPSSLSCCAADEETLDDKCRIKQRLRRLITKYGAVVRGDNYPKRCESVRKMLLKVRYPHAGRGSQTSGTRDYDEETVVSALMAQRESHASR